ncbi:alkaline phosphatase family protein [Niabella terrae]
MKRVSNTFLLSGVLAAIVWAGISTGCKKFEDMPPYFEQIDTIKSSAVRKVLLIGVDGVVGEALREIAPANLTAMEQHSKFSYESWADEVTTDAASWKTLLSGVSYAKHAVSDSSFAYNFDGESEDHDAVKQYPSIFMNILSSEKADLSTAIMSPWNNLITKLTPEVENNYVAADDAAVSDSAIRMIQQNRTPAFSVINFNEPAIAGKAGSFSAADAGYKAAINKVDGYIGKILEAVKARPGYNTSEEWLIIVTSTHGGIGNNYGGNSADEINTFIFFYNERFSATELTKEGTFSSPYLNGTGSSAVRAVIGDVTAYDLSSAPMTYEFKVKGSRSGNYPVFFSKRGPESGNTIRSNNDPGFALIAGNGGGIQNFLRGTGSNSPGSASGFNVQNGSWHDIAMTYEDSASFKLAKIYIDGELASRADISSAGDWSSYQSPFPLTFGYKQGDFVSSFNCYISDVKVFNVALTAKEVADNLCTQNPLENHSRKDKIIGYWPCNDGIGGVFKNYAPAGAGKDFVIENIGSWDISNDIPCVFPTSPGAGKLSLVLTSLDVAPTVMYWLGININNRWGWQGSASWMDQFEVEFLESSGF